jgi:hypothetical protein
LGIPLSRLQHAAGNQALLQLLDTGVLQAKLRVSQPGDADEIEADRVADQIVSRQHAPVLQRKCSCDGGGTPCSKCAAEEHEKIHRSVAAPGLRSSESLIQRSPADSSAATSQPAPGAKAETPAERSQPPAQVIVDDEAKTIAPHQMRKSQFVALLRAEACASADAVLASVGHTTKSCPYIAKWLGFYEKQSSQHIEEALHKYAPETAGARNAHEAIRMAVKRVQRAALTWAKTGRVEGVPKELAGQVPGGRGVGKGMQSAASSGGAMRKAQSGEKAPAHDPAAVKSQLGSGHSLDSRVQSLMSTAFGHDFSGVRIHTDSRAASLSSDLQARAFAIGSDVAFAPGEYKPGTLIGDALIAHELAHVVQQSQASAASVPMMKGEDESNALEQDADWSAVGAVASLWTGATGRLADIGRNAGPKLTSGLRLQRCAAAAAPVVVEAIAAGAETAAVAEVGGTTVTLAAGTGSFTAATAPAVVGATAPELAAAGTTAATSTAAVTSATTSASAGTSAATTAATTTSTLAKVGLGLGVAATTQLQDQPRQVPPKEKCTEAEKTEMYGDVKSSCDKVRACSMQTDTCATVTGKISALYACISAREKYQKKCFTPDHPLYKGHMQQIAQAYAALRNCESVMRAKCK